MKKVLAMILVLAMMLVLGVTAFAECTQRTTDDAGAETTEVAATEGSSVVEHRPADADRCPL